MTFKQGDPVKVAPSETTHIVTLMEGLTAYVVRNCLPLYIRV